MPDGRVYAQPRFPTRYLIIGVVVIIIAVGLYVLLTREKGLPSLQLSRSAILERMLAGDSTEYEIRITNPTDKEVQTQISSDLPGWIGTNVSSISLKPDESTTILVTISPPPTAESASGKIRFLETQNSLSVTVDILPTPEVDLSLSRRSISLIQGGKTRMTVTIDNRGESPAMNSNLSLIGIPEEWVRFERGLVNVSGGSKLTKTLTFEIPLTGKTGTYEGALSLQGTGFSKTIPLTLKISRGLGELRVSPSRITGERNSGSAAVITISNTGNQDLLELKVDPSKEINITADVSPTRIDKLESGTSTEVVVRFKGLGERYGFIEVSATDTHSNIQKKFVTVDITLI